MLPAVGADGTAFTVTVAVAGADGQPFTVAMTVYVPDAAVVADGIDGFCCVDMNPSGPLHEYVAPVMADAVRFTVAPAQYAPPLPAVGADGVACTWMTLDEPAVH